MTIDQPLSEQEAFQYVHNNMEFLRDEAIILTPYATLDDGFVLGYGHILQKYINDLKVEGRDIHIDFSRFEDVKKNLLTSYYTVGLEKARQEGSKLLMSAITRKQERWLRSVLGDTADFEVVRYRTRKIGHRDRCETDINPLKIMALAFVIAAAAVGMYLLNFVKEDKLYRPPSRARVQPTDASPQKPIEYEKVISTKLEDILPHIGKECIVITVYQPRLKMNWNYSQIMTAMSAEYEENKVRFFNVEQYNLPLLEALVEKSVLSGAPYHRSLTTTIIVDKKGKEVFRNSGYRSHEVWGKLKEYFGLIPASQKAREKVRRKINNSNYRRNEDADIF
ncbi:hypothetical protein ACFL4W_02825 [Planctomycetota bacterium]